MFFLKSFRKTAAEKIENSLTPKKTGNELTSDDLDLTELVPKFIENMRPRKESELYRFDMEMLEQQEKPEIIPFSTYTNYNQFFGIKTEEEEAEVGEEDLEKEETLEDLANSDEKQQETLM